jgi:hypothetical protein
MKMSFLRCERSIELLRLNFHQYYNITRLHRSNIRQTDECVPGSNALDCGQFLGPRQKGDSLASHLCREEIFPDPGDWRNSKGEKFVEPPIMNRTNAFIDGDVSPREASAPKVRFLKPERPETTLLSPRGASEEKSHSAPAVMKLPAIEPSTTHVMKKSLGNFGRVELANPALPPLQDQNIDDEEEDDEDEEKRVPRPKSIPVHERSYTHDGIFPRKKNLTEFFSRQDVLTSFRQRYPQSCPIKDRYWGKKPADWHLCVSNRSLGR